MRRYRLAFAMILATAAPLSAQETFAPPEVDSLPEMDAPALEVRAEVTPRYHTVLSSEIAARIATISVREGESFEKGARLITFDCDLREARLAEVTARLKAAEKVVEIHRSLDLLGSTSILELAESEAERGIAAAELSAAQTMIERCVIDAPFAGRVLHLAVQPHQYVGEGAELIEILNDRDLEIELVAPSHWLTWLRVGTRLTLHVDETDRSYQIEVARLAAAIDSVSQTIKVYARLAEPAADLLPGMGGRVELMLPG